MGQTYAGILGVLAFTAVLGRGLIRGAQPDSMLSGACLALVAFAVIGLIVGQVGMTVVRDSVRLKFRDQLQSVRNEGKGKQTGAS